MNTELVLDRPGAGSRTRAAVAALLSLLLVVAGAITAPAAFAAGPALSAPEVPRAGGTITVTGSGYSTTSPGIYLGLRAAGATSDTYTVWIDVANTDGDLPGLGATAPMNADGSFSVQIPVPAYSEGVSYNLFSRKGHGVPDPSQTLTQPLAYVAAPAVATSTTLGASPATAVEGASVTLTAAITPAAAGAVVFRSGSSELGTVPVDAGSASLVTSALAVGESSLTAQFVPADAAAFTGSTSAAVLFTVTASTPVPPVFPAPVVRVLKTSGLDRAGETVTVTGSGFVANAPATSGTRNPLAGLFGGSYVVFGKFPATWKPSDGVPSSARKVFVQKWGVHQAQLASIGGAGAGGFVLAADGSFSIDVAVSASEVNDALPGNYGIYTYPGSGATYPAFETFTPITFAEPAPVFEPGIEVFLADGVTPLGDNPVYEGDKLVVKGTGFDPAANVGGLGAPIPATLPQGTFVVFGSFADEWQPSAGKGGDTRVMNTASRQWALAESVLDQVPTQFQSAIRSAWAPIADDGSFTATVTVKAPATPLADGNWGVYTYPGGVGTPANSAQELSVPVAFEGVRTFSPKIEVFAADGTTPIGQAALKAGDDVVVKGTGFDPAANVGGRGAPIPATLPQGTYVVFGNFSDSWKPSSGAASSARPLGQQRWALAESVLNQVPAQFQSAIRGQWAPLAADGSFTATLKLSDIAPPAGGGTYGVYTYGAGGVSNAAQELSVPLNYAPVPKITTSVTDASAAGVTARIVGSQFLSVSGAYAAIIEKGGEAAVSSPDGAVVSAFWTPGSIVRGLFDKTLVAPTDKLDRSKQYEVIVWRQHTVPSASTIYARADLVVSDDAWDDVFVPVVETTVTAASATAGATVEVSGSNLGEITGAYAALIEKGTEASVTASDGFVAFALPFPEVTAGSTAFTLIAPTASLDREKEYEVIVWRQHSAPDSTTIYARADVEFTPAQWDLLFPPVTPPTPPTPPVTPVDPLVPVSGGSLKWAISSSFSNYVTGPIAHGSIAVTNGATRAGGQFQFGQAAGSTYNAADGTGTVPYVGAVRFTGHNGVLDVTIANPQVRITSTSTAALYVTSGGAQVNFATLNLGAATRTANAGTVTYTGAPATLTAAGRDQVLGGFSTSLDAVTFTIGTPAPAPSGSTGTVASAPAPAAARSIPATPPATTGIEADADQLAALGAGQVATVSAAGFQPNEQDIQVVVYSDPVVLGTVDAGADGVAVWTGTLPATLPDGEHTLTFQGSVARGIPFTLARVTTLAAAGCVTEEATLNWGFKETFRNYIEGIAAGGWELTDVAYEYPEFVWTADSGAVDPDARTGLVTYGGSIRFTGHDGALDTTLANARVELAGDTGYLVFDVSGTTQAGDPVVASGIRFAEFALPDLELTADGLVLDALPATLTDAGAAAFGTYPAGEELDPVSAVLPVADCGEPVAVAEDEPVAAAPETTDAAADAADSAPVWPWALGGIALALAIGAAVWIVVARRRTAHATDGSGGPTVE